MLELTPKIIKDIIQLKSLKATTGDIIRAHPGITKDQIRDVLRTYGKSKAFSNSDNVQQS